jgi:hypothetical protein
LSVSKIFMGAFDGRDLGNFQAWQPPPSLQTTNQNQQIRINKSEATKKSGETPTLFLSPTHCAVYGQSAAWHAAAGKFCGHILSIDTQAPNENLPGIASSIAIGNQNILARTDRQAYGRVGGRTEQRGK